MAVKMPVRLVHLALAKSQCDEENSIVRCSVDLGFEYGKLGDPGRQIDLIGCLSQELTCRGHDRGFSRKPGHHFRRLGEWLIFRNSDGNCMVRAIHAGFKFNPQTREDFLRRSCRELLGVGRDKNCRTSCFQFSQNFINFRLRDSGDFGESIRGLTVIFQETCIRSRFVGREAKRTQRIDQLRLVRHRQAFFPRADDTSYPPEVTKATSGFKTWVWRNKEE